MFNSSESGPDPTSSTLNLPFSIHAHPDIPIENQFQNKLCMHWHSVNLVGIHKTSTMVYNNMKCIILNTTENTSMIALPKVCSSKNTNALQRFQDNLQIPSLMTNYNFTEFLTTVLCQKDKKEVPLTA